MDVPRTSELLDFARKSVLVTGAGQGLGAGIARRFAEAGANVEINCRTSGDAATELVRELKEHGSHAIALQADVTSATQSAQLVADVVSQIGGIDVLVNNAGSFPLASLMEMKEEEWDDVLKTNLYSAFNCTRAAASHMQRTGGAIVNIASIEGDAPAPIHSHYSVAKSGVIMHTRAAAQELGEFGIRVNCVSPGLIWREGIEEQWPDGVARWKAAAPLTRLGRPDDVADACLFLASPAARWITGANLVVDGGVMTGAAF